MNIRELCPGKKLLFKGTKNIYTVCEVDAVSNRFMLADLEELGWFYLTSEWVPYCDYEFTDVTTEDLDSILFGEVSA